MERPAAGEIVLVQFPFSDLSKTKLRPAVLLGYAGRDDYILCQVTSNPYGDPAAAQIKRADFVSGALPKESFARPGKLFTANQSLLQGTAGRLSRAKLREIVDTVINILTRHTE